MLTRIQALGFALASACLGTSALAAPSIVVFDVPGAGSGFDQGTVPKAIDDQGDIVGLYSDSNFVDHGFLRRPDGSVVSFSTGSVSSGALGINAHGQATGEIQDGTSTNGFITAPDGTPTTFDVPDSTYTFGSAINASGDVVGIFSNARLGVSHAFLRRRIGTFKKFAIPGDFTSTRPLGISAGGLICGDYTTGDNTSHGFIRAIDGTLTSVDADGATNTSLNAVNRGDTVVGDYSDAVGVVHGLIRTADGSMNSLDVRGAGKRPGQGTSLQAINDKGDIAGYIIDSSATQHSFLRSPRGKVAKFDPPDTGPKGSYATGVNNKHVVVGIYSDAQSVLHGYIRTP